MPNGLPTVTVRQWTDVVRRARLGRTVKAVALTVATYADFETGRRVRPGVARLTVDAEVTYNVVKDALAKLRAAGLIELVRKAASRGESDEYRLILADDLLERAEILSPAQVALEAERIRTQRRGKYRPAQPEPDPDPNALRPTAQAADTTPGADLRPTAQAADPVDNPELRPTAQAADDSEPEDLRPTACTQNPDLRPTASSTCGPRRYPPPPTDLTTTTTPHSDDDVRTAVTVPRARAPHQDPNSREFERTPDTPGPAAPPATRRAVTRCPEHPALPGGTRPDGIPHCPACRATQRTQQPAAPPQRLADVVNLADRRTA